MQVIEQKDHTPEEYLTLEEIAEFKSEYLKGQIITMPSNSTNHNRIVLDLATALNLAFKGRDYEVFASDVRLWMPKKQMFAHPDVMVIAGEPEYFNERSDTILNPLIIAEVLSPLTQGYDREAKFEAYRTLPSFQEYILIEPDRISVEHFSKIGKKQWMMQEYDRDDTAIALASVNLFIPLVDLYDRVKLESSEPS